MDTCGKVPGATIIWQTRWKKESGGAGVIFPQPRIVLSDLLMHGVRSRLRCDRCASPGSSRPGRKASIRTSDPDEASSRLHTPYGGLRAYLDKFPSALHILLLSGGPCKYSGRSSRSFF